MMSSFSCKPLIVVSCVLQVSLCSASGDGWLRLRRSPATPLMSHSSYSMPALSLSAAAPWRLMDDLHLCRTSQLIQGRILHIVTYFQVLWYLCLSIQSHHWSLLFISSFICVLCLERNFYTASAQIKQDFQSSSRWSCERARQTKCEDIFFLTGPTSIQIKSFYLPSLCDIVGVNGVRRRDSSWEHIVGWWGPFGPRGPCFHHPERPLTPRPAGSLGAPAESCGKRVKWPWREFPAWAL